MENVCTPDRCDECPGRLVCRCLQVTEDFLRTAVSKLELKTITDIRQYTGAGDGCTACHKALRRYLERAG
jgi:bacterioferritin-associated ferredoxin